MTDYQFKGPGIQNRPGTRKERRRREPSGRPPPGSARSRSVVQVFALVVGAVFLLVGLLGFVPGVTTNYDQLGVIGPDSQAKLLGLFEVSVLHNLVHLAFGVGVLAAARATSSVAYLVGGGVLYAGVFVYGVVIDQGSDLDILPVNDADNVLHLGLAAGMILLGLIGAALLRRSRART